MKAKTILKIAELPYGRNFLEGWQRLKTKMGNNVVVQGSYNTANIGDLAIGFSIKNKLEEKGIASHLNGSIQSNNWPIFNNYDYHIIGGGGVIRDFPPNYLETRLNPIGTAKKASIAFGVGFNGIRTNEGRKIIKKLEECAFITVRDQKSKENLKRFIDTEIRVSACPAFLTKPKKSKIRINEGTIGINLRAIDDIENQWGKYSYFPDNIDLDKIKTWYINYLHTTLKPELQHLSNENELIFLPFTRHDIVFARQHLDDIPIRILPLQTPGETLDTIQKVNKMICMRYHSIIFSIIAEKPVFIISYQDKTRQLSETLANAAYVDFLNPKNIDINFCISHGQIKKIKNSMILSAKKAFEDLFQIITER